MATSSKIVLHKVTSGLYYVKDASSVTINDFACLRNPEGRWQVRWLDWMSTSHVRWFPTLRDARHFIATLVS